MERLCGIYCIENMIDNKKYIGQSCDIKRRFIEHKSHLNNNNHNNKHLQFAWNKFGENNFEFYIIELCEIQNLDDKETYYINRFNTQESSYGYNIEPGGHIHKSLSEETKCKISASLFGRVFSDEHRQKIADANKSRIISDEQRNNMSKNHADFSGNNNPMYGKRHSDETKKKISLSKQNISDETRQKIRKSSTGRKHSDDAKAKISEAVSGAKHPRCRPIYCPELDEEFWGAKDVENKYGIKACYISACLTGKQKSAGNHPITGESLHWEDINTIQNYL